MKRILGISLSLVIVALAALFVWQRANSSLPQSALSVPQKLAPARVSAAYGSLPLSFEANQGQTDPRVQFLSRGNGYNLFLTRYEAVLSLAQAGSSSVVRMRLVGANRSSAVNGMDELPGKSSYFMGRDPNRWHSEIPNYARVQYRDVFPGVDLVYYGHQGRLEYDFVLAPGADPSRIRIAFQGAQKLKLENGDVVVKIAGGDVRLHQPVLYQRHGEEKTAVDGRFVLANQREVAFAVGAYDKREALVIDPSLVYSTYLGGKNLEKALGVAADSQGNAYVTGSTASADFPITASAMRQKLHSADTSAFVAKLNPMGTALVYSTYLGGSNSDAGLAIAVSEKGEAFVAGSTYSTDFPTTSGALQRMPGGGRDAFVAKLSADGSRLIYASYLGGSGDDDARGIALNAAGEAHVVGETASRNFPVSMPLQKLVGCSAEGACSHAFVSKLNGNGSALLYSSLLGGSGHNSANAIALDLSGAAYVAGHTYASDFPVTAQAFQTKSIGHTACASGRECADAFVNKLSTNGFVLYSARLGGDGDQRANAIAVDMSGNAYVAGRTDSANFATTAHAYQAHLPNHGGSAFVSKLNALGSSLLYSTYLGGSSGDEAMGIAVDEKGRAVVAGATSSHTFPTTTSALQRTLAGTLGAFLASVNEHGSALVYSTLLSGSRSDGATAVALDRNGNVYVVGNTESKNFPVSHALHGTLDGQGSAFVAKFTLPIAAGFASLSPNPLNFTTGFGTTSAPQSSTLTNTGATSLTLTGITLGGANAADFAIQNPAGACTSTTVLAAGAHCTITVVYTARTTGAEAASVTITSDASNGTQILVLNGSGTGPFAVFSASSVSIVNQTPGTTSTGTTFTLTNKGTAALTSIVITNSNTTQFAVTTSLGTNCGGSLAVNAVCTITVKFSPPVSPLGVFTGTITFTFSGFGSPKNITETGNPPIASVSPTSQVFPSTAEGTVAKFQTSTLTNTAKFTALSFFGVTVTDATDYQAASNCPAVIQPLASCTISWGFSPRKTGSIPSTGSVKTNTGNNPNGSTGVSLSGSATAAPLAVLSVTSLTFATSVVQANPPNSSGPMTFTLTNKGNNQLNASIFSSDTNNFQVVNANTSPCGTFIALAVNASCNVAVIFAPNSNVGYVGKRQAILFVQSNSGNVTTQNEVLLAGTATGLPLAQVCVTGSNPCSQVVTFPGSTVQANPANSSAPQQLTMTNTGQVALTINNIFFESPNPQGPNGQFQVAVPSTNQCVPGHLVNPGANCNIAITFNPTLTGTTGPRTDVLVVRTTSGNPNNISDVNIKVTGVASGTPSASLSVASLAFSPQAIGNTSAASNIVLSNSGTNPLAIFGIFFQNQNGSEWLLPTPSTNACPSRLAAGANCNISIQFSPKGTVAGPRMDVLRVQTNAGNNNNNNSFLEIPVTGTATGGTSTMSVTLSTGVLNFGSQPVGAVGTPLIVTITNNNPNQMNVGVNNQLNDYFIPGGNCNPIPKATACNLQVYFVPTQVGPRNDILFLSFSSGGAFLNMEIPMVGNGTGTVSVSPSPTSLVFPSTTIGTTSASQTVTITNNGTVPAVIDQIFVEPYYNLLGTFDFTVINQANVGNNCNVNNQVLQVGASCVVNVYFTPQNILPTQTTRTATLIIETTLQQNVNGTLTRSTVTQQSIALSGTAAGTPALTVSPASINFLDISTNTTTNVIPVTVKNTGTAPLNLFNFTTIEGELRVFAFGATTNGCTQGGTTVLQSGASCVVYLQFLSGQLGLRNDGLVLRTNVNGQPTQQTVVPTTTFVTP